MSRRLKHSSVSFIIGAAPLMNRRHLSNPRLCRTPLENSASISEGSLVKPQSKLLSLLHRSVQFWVACDVEFGVAKFNKYIRPFIAVILYRCTLGALSKSPLVRLPIGSSGERQSTRLGNGGDGFVKFLPDARNAEEMRRSDFFQSSSQRPLHEEILQ